LSDDAATALADYAGTLHLEGLIANANESRTLSGPIAILLSKHTTVLSLNDITFLSNSAAEGLARFDGERLSLGRLRVLTDTAAESLKECPAYELFLDGLSELSDAAAKSLAHSKCYRLHLGGLTNLSDRGAQFLLGRQKEMTIQLSQLPDSAAKILSEHPALCHNGLR
jgi:hypothetical protein